jgi:hypothetical protein
VSATVGVLVNPRSGKDVRRLAARATSTPHESRRDEVARAVVGAVAAGADRVVLVDDPFRIAAQAVAALELPASLELVKLAYRHGPEDSIRGAERLRQEGCGALIALGGDGTCRAVAQGWPDVALVPLSTGTNNVFPLRVEATVAGAAAGLVASGQVEAHEVAPPVKVVRIAVDEQEDDLALIDAVFLHDDRVGNFMPFEAGHIRCVVLSRADPASIGMSPIGGLLHPCAADDDFGVVVHCVAHESGGRRLRVPLSAGLYGTVHVAESGPVELGKVVSVTGPGVLAFDGDRERTLRAGQRARLRVVRDGPRVIDVSRTLSLAAERGLFHDLGAWSDGSGNGGIDCC